MDEDEMYEKICKERFDKLENNMNKNHEEVMAVLKGTNGKAGLCEKVRTMEKRWVAIFGAGIFLIGNLVIQIISWVISNLPGE